MLNRLMVLHKLLALTILLIMVLLPGRHCLLKTIDIILRQKAIPEMNVTITADPKM
jgi:hypothetical protein